MKKAIQIIILLSLSILAGCKSSCDCFKHSYGQDIEQSAETDKV